MAVGDDKGRLFSLEEEQALVERLKKGDSGALTPLWHQYARTLYRAVIFPRIPIRERAEEVLQNTFLKAYERIGGYEWQPHGIYPWLKTIARNMVMDIHRKNKRTDRFVKGYTHHVEQATATSSQIKRPDDALADAERADRLKVKVKEVMDSGKLNDRYRQVIQWRLFDELPREECARRLDVKVGTLDVLFHRALKRFEALYKQMHQGETE